MNLLFSPRTDRSYVGISCRNSRDALVMYFRHYQILSNSGGDDLVLVPFMEFLVIYLSFRNVKYRENYGPSTDTFFGLRFVEVTLAENFTIITDLPLSHYTLNSDNRNKLKGFSLGLSSSISVNAYMLPDSKELTWKRDEFINVDIFFDKFGEFKGLINNQPTKYSSYTLFDSLLSKLEKYRFYYPNCEVGYLSVFSALQISLKRGYISYEKFMYYVKRVKNFNLDMGAVYKKLLHLNLVNQESKHGVEVLGVLKGRTVNLTREEICDSGRWSQAKKDRFYATSSLPYL